MASWLRCSDGCDFSTASITGPRRKIYGAPGLDSGGKIMKRSTIWRFATSWALIALAWAALGSPARAADDPPKDDQGTGKHTWNDVAESLFKKFDSHNHKFLDKAEFKKANAALDKAIRDLIKQGEI